MKSIDIHNTILIPWSGGLDSTYSVLHYLRCNYIVHAPYIIITNNEGKVKQEYDTIQRFKDMEPFKGYIENGKLLVYTCASTSIYKKCHLDLSQPLIWLSNLAMTLDINNKYKKVVISYVMNDCAVSYKDEIVDIWNSFKGLLTGNNKSKFPDLKFPWIKYNKKQIIAGYKEYEHNFQQILDNVWWCEEPIEGEPCGECVVCERYEKLKPLMSLEDLKVKENMKKRRSVLTTSRRKLYK